MANFRIFKLIKIKYNNMIKSEFYINDCKLKNEDVFTKVIGVLSKYKLSNNVYSNRLSN